jgi:acetyl esterase
MGSTTLKLRVIRRLAPLLIGWNWRGAKARELSVRDDTVPVNGGAIGVRIYTPLGSGPFPMLHFFHGGGWVFGNLDTHDAVCRDLCVQSRRIVCAFDYRLAPEHPFPIPVEDCLASLAWTLQHAAQLGGDADAIALCGDSAGGNLAAITAQQARQLYPGMIKAQVLIYPVTDNCTQAQWNSYQAPIKGGGLTHAAMIELWTTYMRDSPLWTAGMTTHELATPLHAADLAGLPPALMLIAEEDPLRDEGIDYARRLEAAGVSAQVERYADELHGFVGLKPSVAYKKAIADIAAWLKVH